MGEMSDILSNKLKMSEIKYMCYRYSDRYSEIVPSPSFPPPNKG